MQARVRLITLWQIHMYNDLLYCYRGTKWRACFDNRKVSYSQPPPEYSITQLWLYYIPFGVLQCETLWGESISLSRSLSLSHDLIWRIHMNETGTKMRGRVQVLVARQGETMWKWKMQLAKTVAPYFRGCLWESKRVYVRIKGACQTTGSLLSTICLRWFWTGC